MIDSSQRQSKAVIHEAAPIREATVEGLVRHAHRALDRAGQVVSPSKVSKTVRRAFRDVGPSMAALLVENWVKQLVNDPDFNTDVLLKLTYADPTGDTAARNVDHQQAKKKPRAATRGQSHQ